MKKAAAVVATKPDEDYQAEEDSRTLERMGEIMGDPKRHEKAKKRMEKKMADTKRSHAVVKKVMGIGKKAKSEEDDDSMGGMIKKHQEEMKA